MLMVVVGVVVHGERVLMIQEAKESVAGTWNLPGGRVEPGEPLVDAMQREIQEEAGLAVELKGLLFVDQVIADGGESESRMRFVFAATPRDPRALAPKTFADEHSLCARWFARGELSMLRMRNPYALEMVERAERHPVLLPIESLRARYGDLAPKPGKSS